MYFCIAAGVHLNIYQHSYLFCSSHLQKTILFSTIYNVEIWRPYLEVLLTKLCHKLVWCPCVITLRISIILILISYLVWMKRRENWQGYVQV